MEILDRLQLFFEGRIDFEGQKLSERVAQAGLTAVTIVAFLVGYFGDSVRLSMLTFGGGVLLVLLATVPQWPIYNQHPVYWLPARTTKPKSD